MDLKLHFNYDKCDMSGGYLTIQVSGRKKCKKGQIEEKTMKFQNVPTVLQSLQPSGDGIIPDEIRVSLLQAILFRLKDSTSPSHSTGHQVCISVDRRTVNVCHQLSGEQEAKTLSEIARLILPEDELISKDLQTFADDFVSKDHCNVAKALTHPLFWSASNKIRYLEMTWAEENCNVETKRLSKCDNGTFTLKEDGKIGDSWTDALVIPENECEDLNEKLKKSSDTSLCIEQSTMSKFTEKVSYRKFTNDGPKDRTRKYEGSSWKDFLFFFRNIHAHFHEQKEEIRCCFNYDSEEGYWGFFSRRFPGLFMNVFKRYGHSVSFKDIVEPKFLPSLEKTGSKVPAAKPDNVSLKHRFKSRRTYAQAASD